VEYSQALAKLSFHFIPLDHAILDKDDAVGVLGDVVLVVTRQSEFLFCCASILRRYSTW